MFKERIIDIAQQRNKITEIQDAILVSDDILRQYPVYQQLLEMKEQVTQSKKQLKVSETSIREDATAYVKQTGDMSLPKGLKVQQRVHLDYEEAIALDWLYKHMPHLVTINAKEFEKVAKTGTFDFVDITKEPTIAISSDLSEYLLLDDPEPEENGTEEK